MISPGSAMRTRCASSISTCDAHKPPPIASIAFCKETLRRADERVLRKSGRAPRGEDRGDRNLRRARDARSAGAARARGSLHDERRDVDGAVYLEGPAQDVRLQNDPLSRPLREAEAAQRP